MDVYARCGVVCVVLCTVCSLQRPRGNERGWFGEGWNAHSTRTLLERMDPLGWDVLGVDITVPRAPLLSRPPGPAAPRTETEAPGSPPVLVCR